MKSIKLSILAVAAAIALSAFSGCTGETGAAGPAGANGTNGNANVVTTNGSVTNWSYNGTNEYWYALFSVSALTSDIATSGAVEVFFSTDGVNWIALPYTYIDGLYDNGYWSYIYSTGQVSVNFAWGNAQPNNDPNATFGGAVQFNIVCIAASAIKQNPNTNLKNYTEVSQLPGVKVVHMN